MSSSSSSDSGSESEMEVEIEAQDVDAEVPRVVLDMDMFVDMETEANGLEVREEPQYVHCEFRVGATALKAAVDKFKNIFAGTSQNTNVHMCLVPDEGVVKLVHMHKFSGYLCVPVPAQVDPVSLDQSEDDKIPSFDDCVAARHDVNSYFKIINSNHEQEFTYVPKNHRCIGLRNLERIAAMGTGSGGTGSLVIKFIVISEIPNILASPEIADNDECPLLRENTFPDQTTSNMGSFQLLEPKEPAINMYFDADPRLRDVCNAGSKGSELRIIISQLFHNDAVLGVMLKSCAQQDNEPVTATFMASTERDTKISFTKAIIADANRRLNQIDNASRATAMGIDAYNDDESDMEDTDMNGDGGNQSECVNDRSYVFVFSSNVIANILQWFGHQRVHITFAKNEVANKHHMQVTCATGIEDQVIFCSLPQLLGTS